MNHPLPLGTRVKAHQPTCPCSGAKFKLVEGAIKQVFHYPSGVWYFLDSGATISSQWIVQQ